MSMATSPIPAVDSSDLERAYELRRLVPADRSIGLGAYTATCKPGADLEAVCRRMHLLVMLANFSSQEVKVRLAPWLRPGGVWTAPAFRAASRFQMDWYTDVVLPSMEQREEFIKALKAEGY